MVSRVESGCLECTTLRVVRRVAMAVGVSVPFAPQWRGADLAKLLDARHSELICAVVERLTREGWTCRPEHTFNEWGERGSIDILAWHEQSRAVLCLEIKTRLVDLQDLLSAEDRKRRLAPTLARKMGWQPLVAGSVLVLPEEHWARNAVERQKPVFDSKFPARTMQLRRWLRNPSGNVAGIWFLANSTTDDPKRRSRGSMRVRPRLRPPSGGGSRSAAR